jgi:hypothetical protein
MDWIVVTDRMLHTVAASLSVLLFLVSYRAYKSKRGDKFLYISAAFGIFFVKETLLFLQSWAMTTHWAVDFSAHVLNLMMLLTFLRGITK